MGDHHHGLFLPEQVGDGLFHRQFVLDVQGCCGLVQQQNGAVLQNGPGYGDALALAAGEPIAILPGGGIVSLFHVSDEAVAVGRPAGRLDFSIGGIGAGVSDIVPDGVVKEEHILIHHGDLLQHPLRRHMARGPTANRNSAAGGFIVFGDQVQDGGLAGAGVPHDGGKFLVRYRKGSLLQHRLSRNIGEVHMVKGDLMGIRLERLHAPALLRLFHDAQDFIFGNHQVFVTG